MKIRTLLMVVLSNHLSPYLISGGESLLQVASAGITFLVQREEDMLKRALVTLSVTTLQTVDNEGLKFSQESEEEKAVTLMPTKGEGHF